jgi:cell division protein FtsB
MIITAIVSSLLGMFYQWICDKYTISELEYKNESLKDENKQLKKEIVMLKSINPYLDERTRNL